MDAFEAIADRTRRRLIELLAVRERSAGELVAHFEVSFSAISQHLRILSDANLVSARRAGRSQIYRLQSDHLDPVAEWLTQYAENFWKKKLAALGGVLNRLESKTGPGVAAAEEMEGETK